MSKSIYSMYPVVRRLKPVMTLLCGNLYALCLRHIVEPKSMLNIKYAQQHVAIAGVNNVFQMKGPCTCSPRGRHYLVVPMANHVDQHAERRLPFDADWEQASLMGSLPTRLVHCLLRLTAPHTDT